MISIFIVIIFILFLLHPQISSVAVVSSFMMWGTKLVPVLYPSFILIDLLNTSSMLQSISFMLYPFFKKITNLRYPYSTYILLLSLICGAPSSTKLIKDAYEKEYIDSYEVDTLLHIGSCFSLSYTIIIINLFEYSPILFYILTFLYAFIFLRFRNRKATIKIKRSTLVERSSMIKSFLSSTSKNIDILISILGIMIFFNVILNLIHIPSIFYPYFEILNGHGLLQGLNIKEQYKCFLLISSLSFLGFSLHLQILYIYPELKYKSFLINKLFQGFTTGILFTIFSILY